MMPYDVIEARHVAGFVLWLRFRDGTAARSPSYMHGTKLEGVPARSITL